MGMVDARPSDDESSTGASPRRFGRFAPRSVARRVAVSKIWRVGLAALILGTVLIAGGSSVTRSIVAWVWERPEYEFTLDRVRFDPPPPEWIIGGRSTLVEPLRPFAKEKNSVLALDLAAVAAVTSKCPWVRRVDRVVRIHPNVVEIKLRYREPVAKVGRPGKRPLFLDADGVILPEEIDAEAVGPIITLIVNAIPASPSYGLVWPKADGSDRVVMFAKLAAFLTEKIRKEPNVLPSLKEVSLYSNDPPRFWVELGVENFLLWGVGPELEQPTEPSNEAKWDLIRDRVAKSGPLKLVPGHYYVARKDGVASVKRRAREER